MENSLSNSSSINSIINLKILLTLVFYQKGIFFKNVQKLVNKSKSQLSVSLGKLERRGFITKTEIVSTNFFLQREYPKYAKLSNKSKYA